MGGGRRIGKWTLAAFAGLAIALAGCSSRSESKPAVKAGGPTATAAGAAPEAAAALPVAAGTALPPGYKIDAGRTLIFGTDENWTGRLSYTTSTSADDVFDFLHREMPNFGWTETTAMRSDVSLINFASTASNRVATIHIERGSALGGSTRVEMVVSPVAGAPAGRGASRPATPGAPTR
jgi:hypothetical protein